MDRPVRVAVTGAAGSIGYALLFRIAAGDVLGPGQSVVLQLLEIPPAMEALEGVAMELTDGAFPLLDDLVLTDEPRVAFEDAAIVCLVGAKPRGSGQERRDLLRDNAPIFREQGRALTAAAPEVRVATVGNPANTNCLVAAANAEGVPRERFTSMMRLDQNRAAAQLAARAGVGVAEVSRLAVWGNHSPTMFPDFEHARIGGRPATEVLDRGWLEGDFLRTVQGRGGAVIEARGQSSAASAASALIDHLRDWCGGEGTGRDDWVSMGVASDGSYGVPEGLICGLPVTTDGAGGHEIVTGLELSDYARERIAVSVAELEQEREAVADLLA